MSYSYGREKPELFTDRGRDYLRKVIWVVLDEFKKGPTIVSGKVMDKVTGDLWMIMACLDRLEELGLIECVTRPDTAGQDRMYRMSGRAAAENEMRLLIISLYH